MTEAYAGSRKLDLGRVFGDTFGVIRRQAVPLIGVTILLSFLPGLVNGIVSAMVQGAAAPSPAAPFAAFRHPLYQLTSLLSFIVGAYSIACQYRIAIGDLEGRRPPLSEVFRDAAGKILPVIGAMLLFVIGIGLGFMLLFVPGLILGVMWVVALPAVVADTSNPVKALGRSRALTKGNRWRIFGLLVLLWVLVLVVEGVFFGGAAVIGVSGGAGGAVGAGIIGIFLAALFAFLLSVGVSVGSAALYVQLREIKGGGGEHVAQVFA